MCSTCGSPVVVSRSWARCLGLRMRHGSVDLPQQKRVVDSCLRRSRFAATHWRTAATSHVSVGKHDIAREASIGSNNPLYLGDAPSIHPRTASRQATQHRIISSRHPRYRLEVCLQPSRFCVYIPTDQVVYRWRPRHLARTSSASSAAAKHRARHSQTTTRRPTRAQPRRARLSIPYDLSILSVTCHTC